jgi:hypothetical protein
MEPASRIIERFGGVGKVAEIVGVHRTRVSNWRRPKSHGGTDGRIPQTHHLTLLSAARASGIPLAADDFLALPSSAPAEAINP